MNMKTPHQKPTGKAKHDPCYNVARRSRRRFLHNRLRKLTTVAGRIKLRTELRRRCRISPFWANEANADGIKALSELALAIFDDLDLRTWQTRHSLETLAERAGLVTYSDNGNKSISRASRAADRLAWLNVIITEKPGFNPFDARRAVKHIDVTEEFFKLLGVSLKDVYREREKLTTGNDTGERISSWDSRLTAIRVANWQRMAEAGLARMQQKRAAARERKRAYFAPA